MKTSLLTFLSCAHVDCSEIFTLRIAIQNAKKTHIVTEDLVLPSAVDMPKRALCKSAANQMGEKKNPDLQ